jgi:hypothetical protein
MQPLIHLLVPLMRCLFSRLMAEKVNKNERKNKAEIITEMPGDESSEFWKVLGDEEGMPPRDPIEVMPPRT